MLIDSDKERLRTTGPSLLSCGMRVSYALTAETALAFFKSHMPDVILLHCGLPGSLALLSAVKGDQRLDGVPVLLLTSGTEDGLLLESLFEAGASDFIQLPPSLPFALGNRVGILLAAGRKALPKRQSSETAAAAAASDRPLSRLSQIEGISFDEAVKNCGGEDVLKTVMQKFFDSIEERAGALEGFVSAGDWKNYRIAVHSLKSSARLIGAMQLSQDAKALEAAADALRTEEIVDKNPALLELYRSYRQKLLPVVAHEDAGDGGKGDDRPLLSEEDFASACRDLRECLEISDFDSADYIMDSLAGYRISENRRDFISHLKKAVGDVNKKEALALLSDI